MKLKNLDELQLIKRGNVFKHCLFTVIGLLMLYVMALELDIVFMSQRNALVLIILFVVSLFCIEMICCDIYPLSEKRQKFLYFFEGIFGTVIVTVSIYEIVSGEAGFIENEMLTDAGAGVIMGGLFILILLAYIGKSVYNKKIGELS
jgi:hypothetical protein